MRAGRELDALVAERVMGETAEWREKVRGTCLCGRCEKCSVCSWPLPYSTDIAAAWEVMEKMPQIMSYRRIQKNYRGGWSIVCVDDHGHSDGSYSDGETLPHAICLAALKLTAAL